jgi:acyl-CoA thioester hydrolase
MEKKFNQISLKLRIDWSEIDLYGHVNNVSFFKYIQSARVNFWEKTGIYALYGKEKMGPLLVSSKCEFRKPLHYPGNITIQSKMEYIKNTSFCITHQIFDEKEIVVADAADVMVLFDYSKQCKINFPEDLKMRF